MTTKELKNNSNIILLNADNKNTFPNMEKWINKNEFENILKKDNPETKKLYFNTCKYNQALILNNFIKLLFENFKNRMLLNKEYHEKILIDTQNPEETKQNILFLSNSGDVHTSFIIDSYIYYIQFDPNPFFDNSSYITCKQLNKIENDCIYKGYQNKIFYYNHFGGGRNINDLFEIFDKNLNAEEAAKKLYNYFINNHFEKENATDRTKRITFINQDKNKYNIKVLEKD